MADLTEDLATRPSRRKLLIGTAWAVPVVMGVGATRVYAASLTGASAGIVWTVSTSSGAFTFTFNSANRSGGDKVWITAINGASALAWKSGKDPVGPKASVNSATTTINGITTTAPNSVTYTVYFSYTAGTATLTGSCQFTYI